MNWNNVTFHLVRCLSQHWTHGSIRVPFRNAKIASIHVSVVDTDDNGHLAINEHAAKAEALHAIDWVIDQQLDPFDEIIFEFALGKITRRAIVRWEKVNT